VTYATISDLQDRLGEARLVQLTDRADPPLGLVDTLVAQNALNDAEAEINGYLVARYSLPLAPAPDVLRVHTLALAVYRLLGNQVTDMDLAEVKAVRQYLTQVSTGAVALLPPNAAGAPEGLGNVLFSAGSKVMGRDAY
jgi:phage gp36-like protein